MRIVCGRSTGERDNERFHVPPLDRSGEVEAVKLGEVSSGGTDEWRAEGADQSDADAPPPNKHV